MKFITVASMKKSRQLHSAELLPSGNLLIIGGMGENEIHSTCEQYEINQDYWRVTANLKYKRYFHTSTTLKSGKVLIVGGVTDLSSPHRLSSVELYDPVSENISLVADLSSPRAAHSAILLPSGKVLVVGGARDNGSALSEVYDPDTNNWISSGSDKGNLIFHTSTLVRSGNVIVIGGRSNGLISTVKLFVSSENYWTDLSPLRTGRIHHSATLLPSNQIIITGGMYRLADGSIAELYDVASNSWHSISSPDLQRVQHEASMFNSEFLIEVGGKAFNRNNTEISPSALYSFKTNRWSTGPALTTPRVNSTITRSELYRKVIICGGKNRASKAMSSVEVCSW